MHVGREHGGDKKEDVETKKILKVSIRRAHECLGHLSEDTTHGRGANLGMNILRGSLPICEPCTMAKAKQRNIPKKSGGEKAT